MTSRDASISKPWSGADWIALVAVVVIGAMIPATIAASSGSAVLPRNDDWSYRGIALDLYQSGQVRLDGASQTFAVGQVLLTLPLLAITNGSPNAFYAFGIMLSAVAAAFAYGLSRLFLTMGDAMLVVAALIVVPGYAAYSSSYMTDVPALAGQLIALYCGVRAFRSDRRKVLWFVAAVIVGAAAFSTRQFAVVAPLAVVTVALIVYPRRISSWAVAVLCLGLVGAAVWFQSSLPGQVGATPVVPGGLARAIAIGPSLALFLLPLSLRATLDHPPGRLVMLAATTVVGIYLGAWILVGGLTVTLDNLMSPWGVPTFEYIVGGRPELLGSLGWNLLQGASLLALFVLITAAIHSGHGMVAVVRHRLSEDVGPVVVLALFTAVTLGGLALYAARWNFFDRYLWPLLAVAGILILYRSERRELEFANAKAGFVPTHSPRAGLVVIGAMAALGVVGGMYALNSMAFDAGRWRAGERLVELGYAAEAIDGGYEWLGTYAPGPVMVSDRQVRAQDALTWYANIWPSFRRCALVAGARLDLDGFELIETRPEGYRLLLAAGPAIPLYLYRSTDAACEIARSVVRGGLG